MRALPHFEQRSLFHISQNQLVGSFEVYAVARSQPYHLKRSSRSARAGRMGDVIAAITERISYMKANAPHHPGDTLET